MKKTELRKLFIRAIRLMSDPDKLDKHLESVPKQVIEFKCDLGMSLLDYSIAISNTMISIPVLIKHGVPINNPDYESSLNILILRGELEYARLMIANGASVDEESLYKAISHRDVEFVKLIVDKGVNVNFYLGRFMLSPLAHAIRFGCDEIAEYLLSKGALIQPENIEYDPENKLVAFSAEEGIHPDQVKETVPEGYHSFLEIPKFFEEFTGNKPEVNALQQAVQTTVVPVASTSVIWEEARVIFSIGSSDEAMNVPDDEEEELAHCEYAMLLPKEWPELTDPSSHDGWPWRRIREIGVHFHETNTWPQTKAATLALADPPEPIEPGSDYYGFILLYNQTFGPFTGSDGRTVNIVTVAPLYKEELEFALEKGVLELVVQFGQQEIYPALIPGRPNLCE